MSEKRFFTKINKNGRNVIIDKECHIEIIDLTLACEVLNRLNLKLKTYNEQLGEQQATISQLQDLCGKSDYKNAKLRIENKKLKEMDEQLREINKQIGDDLHNCRLNKNIISEKLKLWQDAHKEYDIYSIDDFEELLNGLKKENEQLKEELNNLKKDETLLYHYYTLARYGGDGV